jgi:hypothetical protein
LNQDNKSSDIDFKKEEIRGLFVLGLLAVLASIRAQSDKIMVTFGELSFDVIPMLDMTIVLWSFYAVFMVFGLSEDMLGKSASKVFRDTAKTFLTFNFLVLSFMALMLGFLAYPSRLPWALALIILLILYAVFEEAREITKHKKLSSLLKLDMKKWAKLNLRPLSTLLILLSFTMIMFGSDARYVIPFFIIGCVGITIFIIATRQQKGKNATEAET